MEILDCLNKSKSIKSYEILDFKSFENGFYIKIKAIIINNTELFIKLKVSDLFILMLPTAFDAAGAVKGCIGRGNFYGS